MSYFACVRVICATVVCLIPVVASAQQQGNVPPAVQRATQELEDAVERYGIGVSGGVGVDPELVMFGAHGTFGPIFRPRLSARPGIEFGLGEVTTFFAINLELLYRLPGAMRTTRWVPYVGAGPSFGLSHQHFDDETLSDTNRFDFGDTDFETGFNFIVGARSQTGMFFEMKATAGGISNIRLLGGFNF